MSSSWKAAALGLALAPGAALADPCADERVLGRAPHAAAATVASGELLLRLKLATTLFDGMPTVGVEAAELRWSLAGAPAETWLLTGPPGDGLALEGGSTAKPAAAPAGQRLRQCEPAASVHHRAVSAPAADPLVLRWTAGHLAECRLRVPLDGPWAPGARLRITVEAEGKTPLPLAPSLPAGAVKQGASWMLDKVEGDLVVDIPGCS